MEDPYSDISRAIEHCQPRRHCWFKGFCDILLSGYDVNHDDRKFFHTNSEIIFVDEEGRFQLDSEFFSGLKKHLIVVGNPVRYQELVAQKANAIYFPWYHWFLHLLPWRRLKTYPKKTCRTDKTFNFLNRRWHPGRKHLIEYMFLKHPDLINKGYITANTFSYYQDHPLLHRDTEFEKFYQDGGVGYQLNNTRIDDIPCSVNLQNIFYMAENVPGKICIQVESAHADHTYFPWISEKSMMAFATHQIPIIVTQLPGLIDLLRDQGFDVFDDIIDHGYDRENDYILRLESAINLNKKILSGESSIPDITERLIANQRYLLGAWMEKTSVDLVNKIRCFSTSKEETV